MFQGKVIGVAIFFFFIFAGLLYYSFEYSEKIQLIKAASNMQGLDSYTVEFDVAIENIEDEKKMGKFNFTGEMNADFANEKMSGDIYFRGDFQEMGMNLGISLPLSIVIYKENLYLKVEKLPFMITMLIPREISEKAVGEWIFVSLEDIEELEGGEDIDEKEIEEAAHKLVESFLKRDILLIKGEEREYLDGKEVSKYEINIDTKEFIDFLEEDLYYFIGKIGVEDFDDFIKEEEERQKIVEVIESLQENMSVYVWADENYIYKINFDFEIGKEEAKSSTTLISSNFRFKNFNKSFGIEPPENFIPMEDLTDALNFISFFREEDDHYKKREGKEEGVKENKDFLEIINVEEKEEENNFPEDINEEKLDSQSHPQDKSGIKNLNKFAF